MANQNLQLLVTAALNQSLSLKEINKGINKLEKNAALKAVTIRFHIEDHLSTALDNLNSSFKELAASMGRAAMDTNNKLNDFKVMSDKAYTDAIRMNTTINNQLNALSDSMNEMANTLNVPIVLSAINDELHNIIFAAIEATEAASGAGGTAFDLVKELRTSFYQLVPLLNFEFFINGINYVNELNKSLTDLSITLGLNQRQVAKYGDKFHDLGMDMGFATEEIAKGAVEFARQGLQGPEMFKSMESAIKFAKISNLDFVTSGEILSSTVENMGVTAEQASDVFIYFGNKTGNGADKIGEAMQKIGSSSSSVGLQFEKVASWVSAISSRSGDSASAIGKSVESILSRIQTLQENGTIEEDGTKLYQVEQAVESAGVKFTDAAGYIRNFGDVMDELGVKWDSLSDREQIDISTAIAGSADSGTFKNLMEGYANSVSLYEGALNSAGLAQEKFNLYQDGTEAKLTQLQNAWTGVFQAAFDSSTINGLTGALTVLINILKELVDITGILPVVLGTIGFAAAALSTSFRTLAVGIITLKHSFTSLTISAATAKLALRSFLATSLVGGAFAALGFVLEKTINLLFSAKDSQEDFYENLKNQVSETESNISKLEELNKQNNNAIKTQEELNSLRSEMSDIMPRIIDHYDAEGKAVYKTAAEIDKLIKKEKELNLARSKNVYHAQSEKLKETAEEIASNKEIVTSDTRKKDLETAQLEFDALTFAQDYFNNNELGSEYDKRMEYFNSQIQKIFSAKGQEVPYNFLVLKSFDEISAARVAADKELKDIENTFSEANIKIAEGVKGFTEHFQNFNDILIKDSEISDLNMTPFLDNFASAFAETADLTESNSDEIILQYETFSKRLQQYINDNNIDITKIIESGDKEKLKNLFLDVGVNTEIAEKAIDMFSDALSKNDGAANAYFSELTRYSENYKNMPELLGGLEKEITPLNKALNELQENHLLTTDTVKDLVLKYPELASSIKQTSDGWIVEENILESLRITKLNHQLASIGADLGITASAKQQLLNRLKLYGIEIDSLDSLSKIKEAMMMVDAKAMGANGVPVFTDEQLALKEQLKIMAESRSQLDIYEKLLSNPKFGITKSGASAKEEKSTDEEKPKEIYKPNLQLDETDNELNRLNRLLDENQKKIDEAKAKGWSYNSQLSDRIELYKALSSELNKIKYSQITEQQKLGDKLSKLGLVDSSGKVVSDVEKKLIALSEGDKKKRLGLSIQEIEALVQRYIDLPAEIDNINSQMNQSVIDLANALQLGYEQIQKTAERNQASSNRKISLLGEIDTEAEKKLLAKYTGEILQSIKDQRNSIQAEIEKTKKIIATTKDPREKKANETYLQTLSAAANDATVEAVKVAGDLGKQQADAVIFGIDKEIEEHKYQKSLLGTIDTDEEKAKAQQYDERIKSALINGKSKIDQEIAELQRKLTTPLSAEEHNRVETKLNTHLEASRRYQLEIVGALEDEQQKRSEHADKIIDDYKNMLQKRQELEEKAVEKSIELEKERHEDYIKNLDEEQKKFQKYIQDRIDELDKVNAEDDYNENLNKLLAEKQNIQNQINTLSLDDSYKAKAKRKELEEQLSGKNDEIQKMERDRSREQQKQALQVQLSDREEYLDELRGQEDELHKNNLNNYDIQKENIALHFKEILENEQQFITMKNALMSNNQQVVASQIGFIKDQYASLFDFLKANMDLFESSDIFSNFQYSVHDKAVENLGQYTSSPSSASKTANSPAAPSAIGAFLPPNQSDLTTKKADWEDYLRNKDNAENLAELIKSKASTEQQKKDARVEIARLSAINQRYRDKHNFPDKSYNELKDLKNYHNGGEVGVEGTSTKSWWEKILKSNDIPAILRKGEVVLDSPLQFIHNIANMMSSGISGVVPLLQPSAASAGTIIESIQLTVNGVVKNGEELADQLVNGLNRRGVRLGR